MTRLNDLPLAVLQFYATAPYPCSYLPDRMARSQVATPSHLIDDRSTASSCAPASAAAAPSPTGRTATTAAPACRCASSAEEFEPNRAQRRAWKRHGDADRARCSTSSTAPSTTRSTCATSRSRHSGGGMDQDSREQYRHFLLQSNVDTRLIEFREDGTLRMVIIVDELPGRALVGLHVLRARRAAARASAPTTSSGRSSCAAQLDLPYLYLGYWIAQSRKMATRSSSSRCRGFVGRRVAQAWRAARRDDEARVNGSLYAWPRRGPCPLSSLDPRHTAHAICALARCARSPDRSGCCAASRSTSTPRCAQRDGPRRSPTPSGLAAGLDKNGEYIDALARARLRLHRDRHRHAAPAARQPEAAPVPSAAGEAPSSTAWASTTTASTASSTTSPRRLARHPRHQHRQELRYADRARRRRLPRRACARSIRSPSYVTVNISSPNTKDLRDLQGGSSSMRCSRRSSRSARTLAGRHAQARAARAEDRARPRAEQITRSRTCCRRIRDRRASSPPTRRSRATA